MTIYTIVSIAILAVLTMLFVSTVIRLCFQQRNQRVKFLKQFKRGNCLWAYLAALPMYFMGYLFDGINWFLAVFLSINDSLSLIVLDYETGAVENLMSQNPVYATAVVVTFLVVTANAGVFLLSLLDQIIWIANGKRKFTQAKGDRLLVVGFNDNNLQIYNSDNSRQKLLLCDLGLKDGSPLYLDDVHYVSEKNWENYCQQVVQESVDATRHTLVVVNTQCEENNIKIANAIKTKICDLVNQRGEQLKNETEGWEEQKAQKHQKQQIQKFYKRLFGNLTVYVFGSTADQTIYDEIVQNSFGCVRYVDKYTQIATDFVDNYPLTKFMNANHIDFEKGLVKDGVTINVVGVGYGDVLRQILKTSVANNQFLTEKDGDLQLKQVNYHIFDKHDVVHDKNLNHSFYHYRNEFFEKDENGEYVLKQDKQQGYLPLPELPSKERFYQVAIENADFNKNLKQILTMENSVNVIIICFGNDLENIDLAYKLAHMKQEWNANLTMFVRVRTGKEHCEIFQRDDCFMFADEEKVVYSVDKIHKGKVEEMAKMCDRFYSLEYDLSQKIANAKKGCKVEYTQQEIDEIFAQADYDWHATKTQQERLSNTYACLSIRSKLNLMGLDYAENCQNPLDEKQYFEVYDKESTIKYLENTAFGKKVVDYDLNFQEGLRTTLATHEHYRWNSFMISCGTIPATIDQIKVETIITKEGKVKFTNGKNYQCRRHGNLTTMKGLVDFRQIVAKRNGCEQEDVDVIKYDYQLMDNAHWLLTSQNYKIFKK